MAGSLLMLGSILYLHGLTNSFDYVDITKMMASGQMQFTSRDQMFIFVGLLAAFAVKAPIFPLHTWLPNTYAEAPMPATLLLAAVMSKMGTYGLLRFGISLSSHGSTPLCPLDCDLRDHRNRLWSAAGVGSAEHKTFDRLLFV